ncbi:MAG: hypothetical protein KJ622_06280 [Alphaproteobacteria bacterium]|nr:hypothetical protein [Alphaproteobacteria bacterium]
MLHGGTGSSGSVPLHYEFEFVISSDNEIAANFRKDGLAASTIDTLAGPRCRNTRFSGPDRMDNILNVHS